MKISVQIAGSRNGNPIDIPVSQADNGDLEFELPSAGRSAPAASFSVPVDELEGAIAHLKPTTPGRARDSVVPRGDQ